MENKMTIQTSSNSKLLSPHTPKKAVVTQPLSPLVPSPLVPFTLAFFSLFILLFSFVSCSNTGGGVIPKH
jgi:hypothetical protein